VAEELMPPVEGGFGCFMYQYQELTPFPVADCLKQFSGRNLKPMPVIGK
jgi:hypothetical protein